MATSHHQSSLKIWVRNTLIFLKKQVQAAVFGGILLIALIVTKYLEIPGIHRYDFLFLLALATQAFLILKKYEEPKEILVIAIFHITAMGMEIFKTSPSVGSWQYPNPGFFTIFNVPLFTGFMYSAVGSYVVRAWRINSFQFKNLPKQTTLAVLGVLIYLNFFTNHFVYDIRYVLFGLLIIAFWKTKFSAEITEHRYNIHPLLANALTAGVIWLSEQVGTFAQAWVYPHQVGQWRPVSFHMFTSWYMLLVFSFILIMLIMRIKDTNQNQSRKMIVVCGPTATGKSDLAVEIALFLKEKQGISCEIISTDSRQIYKGLDIGTGKISKSEMKGIPHHLLDIAEPCEKISVVEIQRLANQYIAEIYSRGNIPILCGGTGMYIDSIVYNTKFPDVPPNQILREKLEAKDIEQVRLIFDQLCLDKNITSHQVDISNKRRMIRAIEIISMIGYIPELKKYTDIYDICWIGLDMDDTVLKDRIKKRIDVRLEAGMIEESEKLLASGALTHERMQELGLEYAYISDLLNGKISRAEFEEQLYFAIWHYAKRQRTWFRKNKKIQWFDLSDSQHNSLQGVLQYILKHI